MLQRIAYVSRMVEPFEPEDIAALAKRAAEINSRTEVTGVLCFNGHEFLQVIEGPAEAIALTYARISGDRRHRVEQLLITESVRERGFGEWGMALVRLEFLPLEVRQQLPTTDGRTGFPRDPKLALDLLRDAAASLETCT